jgi:hypothetical protein
MNVAKAVLEPWNVPAACPAGRRLQCGGRVCRSRRRRRSRRIRRGRRGTTALELILNIAVFFTAAMTMYWMGQEAFASLYEIAATIAGSPLY